jgi:ATP-binding cassette, subfamily B, bacterial PglK
VSCHASDPHKRIKTDFEVDDVQDLRLLWRIMTTRERRHGLLVVLVMIGVACFEMLGLASVLPFLTVLANPGLVESNPLLSSFYGFASYFGIRTVDEFLVALGIAMVAIIVFSSLYRVAALYVINRFVAMRRHGLSERLLRVYVAQPYAFFMDRHSGDLIKGVLAEADHIASLMLGGALRIAVNALVAIGVAVVLLIANPTLALIVAVLVGVFYGGVFIAIRRVLVGLGEKRLQANQDRFKVASELISGIKLVKFMGVEEVYLDRFNKPSLQFSRSQIASDTLSMFPQYLVEMLLFGGVVALTLVMLSLGGGVSEGVLASMLPVIGLYAFAATRLKPAVQNLFRGVANLRYGRASLSQFNKDFDLVDLVPAARRREQAAEPNLAFQKSLEFRDVSFGYSGSSQDALKHLNLLIPKGAVFGIVGSTGAGKTTLVDILLGLLRPTDGEIRIDGKSLDDSAVCRWQRVLGYVPQDIFLTDDTVAANIAFGVGEERVDYERVRMAAKVAQIDDFIMKELPDAYDSLVGERGVLISGGQRQRIGIARALYNDPQVLVLDEATSALDTVTERNVMKAIMGESVAKTVIIIAHRLTTVRHCDQIAVLENGAVSAVGSYNELLTVSRSFGELASQSGDADGQTTQPNV